MVCSKAVFAGDCLGVPLRGGLSAASPRYAVGFPLQSLTWMKGLSLSCTCTLAHGLFRPGVRFRPLRQAAWPKPDIGAEGQTEHVRPCRHTGLRLFAKTSRAPVPSERVPRRLSGSRKLTVLPLYSPARISCNLSISGCSLEWFFCSAIMKNDAKLPITYSRNRH